MHADTRVLIVDDEPEFSAPIKAILEQYGMDVREAATAAQMHEILQRFEPDLLLLDVNLPDATGLDIARQIKQTRHLDIIMMSALKTVENRVDGLHSGADYYLPKPVDIRELLAVIASRRKGSESIARPAERWVLDISQWLLTTPDGERHTLSISERNLLQALASHAGETVRRSQLYEALGVEDYEPESRRLDINISRLRRRFTNDRYTLPIKTVHSLGYQFSEPVRICS
ncbi:response regulator transcription factor [Marinobacter nanhaiticus D15-8W]|nr:response regulator transcription factor [Marinobacter nanhaiticus]BES70060.1 response regulator transcription factor [Marinobacter nanhaiticus D15-8W]